MLAQDIRLEDLKQLTDYVYNTLCRYEQLEPGVFPMAERILVRGDKPCGIFFCLHGPRNVSYTAIWETDRNTILFYGSCGDRFHRTRLIAAPQIAQEAVSA